MIDLRPNCVAQFKMNDNAATADVVDSQGNYAGTTADTITGPRFIVSYTREGPGGYTCFLAKIPLNVEIGDRIKIEFAPDPHLLNGNFIVFDIQDYDDTYKIVFYVDDREAYAPETNGLGYYWPLDAEDNFLPQLTTADAHATGKIGGALALTGGQRYIQLNSNFVEFFGLPAWSFNIWEYAYSRGPGDPSWVYLSLVSHGSTLTYPFACVELAKNFNSFQYTGINRIYHHMEFGSESALLNQWVMFTTTVEQINSSTVRVQLYQNAVLVAGGEYPFNLADWRDCARLLFDDPANNVAFCTYKSGYNINDYPLSDCLLDNATFFNKMLSAEEIAFLYNSGNGTEELFEESPTPSGFFKEADGWW